MCSFFLSNKGREALFNPFQIRPHFSNLMQCHYYAGGDMVASCSSSSVKVQSLIGGWCFDKQLRVLVMHINNSCTKELIALLKTILIVVILVFMLRNALDDVRGCWFDSCSSGILGTLVSNLFAPTRNLQLLGAQFCLWNWHINYKALFTRCFKPELNLD